MHLRANHHHRGHAALVAAVLVVLAACTQSGAAPNEGPGRSSRAGRTSHPNVLVIVSDDQRASGTMSVMERARAWLERGGTQFTQAFATTPLCCPSRASIMSGRYAHNHGVLTNDDAYELDQSSTLARYLGDAGYQRALVGKFLNGWDFEADGVPNFDRWVAFHGGYRNRRFNVDGRERRVQTSTTNFIRGHAVRLLRSFENQDRQPWFLYVAAAPPHSPYDPDPRYERASVPRWDPSPATLERDRSDKPPFVQSEHVDLDKVGSVRTDQLRTLMSLDDLIDTVLRTVRDLGEERRTFVLFMSDNGYSWGEHGFVLKRVPYTSSVHIPMYVRWPGRVERGAVDDRLAAPIDVVPTVLDATGVTPELEYPLDGLSLLGNDERELLLLEHWTQPGKSVPDWAALRSQDYEYVEYYESSAREASFTEYYNLAEDPWQLRNLLASDAASVPRDSLAATLQQMRSCTGQSCPH